MTTISTLKNWFKKGARPTQQQFWSCFDSYFHKSEKIPLEQIEGIEKVLELFENQSNQNCRIYPQGQLQIFKTENNNNNNLLEVGDFVIGFVEGQFINATYYGGKPQLLSSYTMDIYEKN